MASVGTVASDRLVVHGGKPLYRPTARGEWPPREATRSAILRAFDSGAWAYSEEGIQGEVAQRFAAAHGAQHGLFLANGTSALLASLIALGVSRDEEVIVPAFTCPTTVLPILLLGAIPVPVDVDPETLCISVESVEAAITARTRAIVAVHMYSALCDLDALISISARRGVALIEDCAHVPGAAWTGGPVGSRGATGFFSFQAKKTITAGEGSIAITSDADLHERLHRIVHVGKPTGGMSTAGVELTPIFALNLAATSFQAAVVSAQFEALTNRLQQYAATYREIETRLQRISGIRLQGAGARVTRRSFNKLCIIFDEGPLADVPLPTIIRTAAAEGLPIRKTYGAVHFDPRVRHSLLKLGWRDGAYPVAETTATRRSAVLDHWWLGEADEMAVFIYRVLERLSVHGRTLAKQSA